MKPIDSFLSSLLSFLRPDQIRTDAESRSHYGQDWSQVLTVDTPAILFPEDTHQVSKVLKLASEQSIAIVPSGGRTGLSGGAVATQGEVVLSLSKLNFIGPLQDRALSLRVGAGAITQAVHEFCEPHGLTWPVDFASKGSSCVGGNIATNAGGVRVIRYGNTRNWVLSVQAVTMDGTIHEFNGELEKNNTGYDFRQLMMGSEGTLAVVTEATLKLCPRPHARLVFFFSLAGFAEVVSLFSFARKKIHNLSAFECLDRASLESVIHHFQRPSPVKEMGEAFVLMEVEEMDVSETALFEKAETWLQEIFDSGLILDGVMAQNEKEAQNLWQYREGVAESILSGHTVHQEDVSVPVAKLEDFYSTIHSRYHQEFPDFKVFFFGHIGDGNLHIFIQKPENMDRDQFIKRTKESDLQLFKVLKDFHGSISAEHGIGLLKKHALGFSRSEPEMEIMRGLKRAFDPKGLLNPGKVI